MEGTSLAREVVNNLFYSQYELLRAFLVALAENHRGLAIELLLSVLKSGGRISGVFWSESIPSASRLAWMCWAELSWLMEKSTGIDRQQRWIRSVAMSGAFESLLYLEEISRCLKLNSLCRTKCSEAACPCYTRRTSEEIAHVHPSGIERDQVDDSCRSQESAGTRRCERPCFAATKEPVRVEKRGSWREVISQCAGDVKQTCSPASDGSPKFDCPLLEYLYSETLLVLNQLWRCENPELKVIPKDPVVVKQDDLHLERDSHLLYADAGGIAEHVRDQIMGLSENTANLWSGRCTALVKKLILVSPELLSAFCKSSTRHSVKAQGVLLSEEGRFSNKEVRVSVNPEIWLDSGDRLMGLANVDSRAHYLVQTEAQSTYLQLVRQSVQMRNLMKAAKQLRYLNDSAVLPRKNYRDVLKNLFQAAAEAGDGDEWLPFNGSTKTMEMIIFSEVLATGIIALCLAAEESRVDEEAEMYGHANKSVVLPVYTRIHKRLQVFKSNEASVVGISEGKPAIATGYKCELFKDACAQVAHIFGGIVNATLSFIEALLFDLAADVLSPVPHLRPLLVVMGWDLLSQKFGLRQKMLGTLWTSWQRAGPVEEQAERENGVGYICEMLRYQLDLTSFLATSPFNTKLAATDRIAFSGGEEDAASADTFVANLVLQELGSHSPMQVLFQFLPDIDAEDALCSLSRQPIGLWGSSRKSDIELVHMYAGIGAATAAMCTSEWDGASNPELPTEKESGTLFGKLREHLELVCTPSRLVWMLDFVLSLLHVELLEMDYNFLHTECRAGCSYSTVSKLATRCTETSARSSISGFVQGEIVAIVKRRILTVSHTMRNICGGQEESSSSIWAQKVSEIARLVNNWEWRLKGLHYLGNSHLPWQRIQALNMLHAAPSTVLNLYLQHGQYDVARESLDRFDMPEEDVLSLLLAEWIQKVEDAASEGGGSSRPETALEEIMGRRPFGAISEAILCLDFTIAFSSSLQSSKPLLTQALRILVESDKKQLSPRNFISSAIKHVLDEIDEYLEQGQTPSLQTLLVLLNINPELRQGPKPRALLLLQQVIGDASIGKRQFLSGKLHNIVKALADDEIDDFGAHPERHFAHKRHGQISLGSDGGLGLGLAAMVGSIGVVGAGGSYQASEVVLDQLKKGGRRWLTFLGNKAAGFVSAFTLYIAAIGDVVDGVDTTHDFNFFSLIRESPKDLLARLVFEQGSLDAAVKVAEVMGVELVQQIISVSVHQVYPPFAGKGWASIFEAVAAGTAIGGKRVSTFRLRVDVIKHLVSVSPARAVLVCTFGNSQLWLENSAVWPQDQGQALLEFTLEQSQHYPVLHRWIQMQWNLQQLFHFPSTQNSGKVGRMKASSKRCQRHHQESCSSGESHTVMMQTEDGVEGGMVAGTCEPRKEVHRIYLPEEPYESSSTKCCGVGKLLFDWGIQHPCADAAWRLAGDGKLVDALALADRWLCDGAPDSLLRLLVEREEGNPIQENEWHPQPSCSSSWISSWQYCIRLRNKNLAARLALRYNNCWELGAAIDVLTMCNCHFQPSDPQFREVLSRRSALLQFSRIMQADDDFARWQEVELLCLSDPEGLALRLSGKGAVSEALEVAESYRLPAELQIELQGRQLVKLFEAGPADDGGPAAGLKFLLQDCESAFPIAMAALDQLPNLQSKQLLVQFISKHHTGRLSKEDREQVDKMVLGLRILGALPVPWQHRCSALHKHPKLIYETLLMWKQWHTALELQQAFPVLEDDVLVLAYAAKAINVSMPANAEPWPSVSPHSGKATAHATSAKSSLGSYLCYTQRGSCLSVPCAFSEHDKESLVDSQVEMQNCGGTLPPLHRAAWEAIVGPAEGEVPAVVPEGYEKTATVTLAEDWVLTGDPNRDEAVRNSHRFESAPCPILFKSLLLLCSHEAVAARAAVDLCVAQAKRVLGEEYLTSGVSLETIERAFSAAGAFVTILQSSVMQLQNLIERAGVACHVNNNSATSSNSWRHLVGAEDNLIDLLQSAQVWLSRIEVFQSLLESGVSASLDDILDEVSGIQLRDRLIAEERYSMAIITCTNCKVDAFPAWKAWGHSLLRTGGYAQAREKLKHALELHKGDPAPTVWDLIMTIEGGPPVDVLAVNDLYLHMVKNVHCSVDDSLSADSYLNVLHVPSFGKSDKARWSCENSPDILAGHFQKSKGEDYVVRSNLDDTHFEECLHYLREFCRQDMLAFSFQHGRYAQASQVLLRASGMFAPPLGSLHQMQSPSFPHRPDWITADYGSLDDLWDLFVGYAAIPVLEHVLGASASLSSNLYVQTAACLQRICSYCEAHRHFNHLYRFQLLKKDHVAAGLCRIQLFQISLAQDEAIRHLEQAKVHFNDGLLARQHAAESVKKTTIIRSPSEKLTEEELMKFTARASIQIDVARSFNDTEGRPWKYSLFGNPHDGDTQRRRCEVVEILLDRNFDLAFKIIYEYSLPRTQIYAGFAASLAARKKHHQLTELLRNIKGTIGDDDLDQILAAAISVYANRHRERPDRLIEMIVSSHRKILALVVCGRLKTAFQVACKAGSVADVQFISHQAQYTQASAVTDLCKQWLAENQV